MQRSFYYKMLQIYIHSLILQKKVVFRGLFDWKFSAEMSQNACLVSDFQRDCVIQNPTCCVSTVKGLKGEFKSIIKINEWIRYVLVLELGDTYTFELNTKRKQISVFTWNQLQNLKFNTCNFDNSIGRKILNFWTDAILLG